MTHFVKLAHAPAPIFALALGAFAPAAAVADSAPCPMTYEQFEYAVPHLDAETCPSALSPDENSFCRISTATDMVHVFKFSYDGDQCLLQMASFYEEDFTLTLN